MGEPQRGQGWTIAAVHGHVGTEGCYFFGEFNLGFGVEAGYPGFEGGARGGVEALEFFGG